jgi:5-methylcytosine-specific restriction protein B
MGINKEIVLETIDLCEKMAEGRKNGTITPSSYSLKFKPFIKKFKDKYSETPNLYLQNELKLFYQTHLEKLQTKIDYKSFGFWGRSIYNYTWSCIYYDFDKEAIPASYSPQLYILINKEGIKFGFCYGHYINDNDLMVSSVLSEKIFPLLKKCFEYDKELFFFNSSKEEVTARPEKLFGANERIIINSDNDIRNNWSSSSLLIKEFPKDSIPENISEIIQNTNLNLKDFFLALLPIGSIKEGAPQKITNLNIPFNIISLTDSVKLSELYIPDRLIIRFISSLLTKPFVILTGLSGSGKTKLAQAFAMWICENDNQYCIVPVGADWTNREPLLGFPNALKHEEYVKPDNRVLDLIIEANKNENKPYFLILDEMNLSHVERYFADFLSVMESKNKIALHPGDNDWNDVPSQIGFPKNLFIIGTVNIDETTYMFSPKVLDRASVIEFRVTAAEMESYLESNAEINLDDLKSEGRNMAGSFVELAKDTSLAASEEKVLNKTLMSFFVELKKTGAEFGYRSASEILRFAAVANKLDAAWSSSEITDAAIMQKLLPKVHGSRRKLEPVLKTLGTLCLQDGQKMEDYISKSEIDFADNTKIKYPISLEKILRMYQSLISNGFTSYAEA